MDIDKTSRCYAQQQLCLTAALFLVALLVARVWLLDSILVPAIVSAVFSLIVGFSLAVIWRRVAKRSPENLPTFFTAVSGFRMLLALATMLVYYLVSDREEMMVFFLVFLTFYFILLAHHSVFFARVSNRS